MRVRTVCGENAYELEAPDGVRGLFVLPSRLRHVVFIRPGSLVLALRNEGGVKTKVCGDIDAVVLDVHMSALRRHPLWPEEFGGADGVEGEEEVEGKGGGVVTVGSESDESELEGNPNMRKCDMYSDSEGD